MNFYKRYTNNNELEVWSELSKIPNVLDNSVKNDIESVLEVMMDRVIHNLDIITQELTGFGYQFDNIKHNGKLLFSEKEGTYNLASKGQPEKIIELEKYLKSFGYLPLSVLKLYERIDNIDLVGDFVHWKNRNVLMDPMVIINIDTLKIMNNPEPFQDSKDRFYVYFSPDEYAKEDVSGSGVYGIYLNKDRKIDSTLFGFGKQITFVNYLRLSFKWGGFPSFEWINEQEVPSDIIKLIRNMRTKLKSI